MSQRNQTTDLSDDRSNEGLPTAADYDPEALGTTEFQSGDPVQQWPEFGLEMVPVEYRSHTQSDWEDTGRRQVVRNGRFISDVTDEYKLLPNEHLVGVANNVARDLGFIPFHEWERDDDPRDGWYVKLDDHVYQDDERRRVHALYAVQSGEVGGDDMEYGFAVHNSIDGSLGFSVGLFSFRHACANMVFMGTGGSRERLALGVESEREILNRHTQKHTASLDVNEDALRATIVGTITLIDDIDATYEAWVSQAITPEIVADLISHSSLATSDLPEWMQAIPDRIGEVYADEYQSDDEDEDAEMPWEHKAEIIEAQLPGDENVWDTYNDLTEAIWHNDSTADHTKQRKMRSVHSVLNPVEHGRHDDLTVR